MANQKQGNKVNVVEL